MIKEYIDYLQDNPKRYWFKTKLYGWGWVPVTWQGWLVIAVYIITLFAFSSAIDANVPIREAFFTFFC